MDAKSVLQLWEEARDRNGLDRAVALSAAAAPAVPVDEAFRHPLGHRNARLLELRSDLTPEPIEMVTACPHCGAELEFVIEPASVVANGLNPADHAPIEYGDRTLHWRPATSQDLMAAARSGDGDRAAAAILEQCLTAVVENGRSVTGHHPDEHERALLAQAIQAADPLCELRFDVTCADCGEPIEVDLDVAATVWSELDRRARRLVSEVHLLASAYGWTEAECLALTARRRATYLEWVAAS